MPTIRAILLATAATALASCTTPSNEPGGVLSSLGVPTLRDRDCREIALDAVSLSAKAFLALRQPAREVREGPGGSVVLAWPDTAAVSASSEVTARDMASIRQESEAAKCEVVFEPPEADTANVTPNPTLPIQSTAELPPPPDVPQAVTDAPSRPAQRSAWSDEPLPSDVSGTNPGNPPPPPERTQPAPSSAAARRMGDAGATTVPRTVPRERKGGVAKPEAGVR